MISPKGIAPNSWHRHLGSDEHLDSLKAKAGKSKASANQGPLDRLFGRQKRKLHDKSETELKKLWEKDKYCFELIHMIAKEQIAMLKMELGENRLNIRKTTNYSNFSRNKCPIA